VAWLAGQNHIAQFIEQGLRFNLAEANDDREVGTADRRVNYEGSMILMYLQAALAMAATSF